MIELIVRIIVTMILAELELSGSPEPVGSSPGSAAVPIARGSEQAAAVLSLLRAVDPCGLHDDVAAAVRVTGDRGDQLLPEDMLSVCRLRVHRGPGEPTWTFTTHVGVVYSAERRQAARREEIDGRWVYRDENRDPHDRSCTYTRTFGPEVGISLTVSAPLRDPGARPCPVATAYLRAARSLSRLVLRVERRTEPRFALAAVDPCAATSAVLRELGVSGEARPEAPYVCRIQPDGTAGGASQSAPVTISFRFRPDPAELVDAGTAHHPVTVAGHAGVAAADPSTGRCELAVAYDTGAAIHVDDTTFVPQITIDAASCDQATTVADLVVHDIEAR